MLIASFVVLDSSTRMGGGQKVERFNQEPAQSNASKKWRPNMLLYFKAKLEELRITYHQFFEVAYQWRFNPPHVPCINDDYCQYLLHGVLPKYVIEYLKHLQQEETCSASAVVVSER